MNVTHSFLLPCWILSRRCLKIVISPRCGVIMNCKRELDTDQVAQMCSSDGILWLKREFPFQARVGPRCAGPQAALPCWLPLLHTRRQRHVIPSRHVATWHVTSRRCAHAHVDGTRPPPLYRPQLLPTHRTVRASQLCQSRWVSEASSEIWAHFQLSASRQHRNQIESMISRIWLLALLDLRKIFIFHKNRAKIGREYIEHPRFADLNSV